jgi:dTDP-4-dehydrorhamnose 3,5-epimerase
MFTEGKIDGVIVRELSRFSDHRGWLIEIFRADESPKELMPLMAYVSETHPNTARGPHEHVEQTDRFAFLGPSNFKVYLWDTRETSSTFGRRMTLVAGADRPAVVVIPPGVVHAYKNIGSVPGWVMNCPNRLYRGPGRNQPVDEIRHEDSPESRFVLD